ncbi:hypothetical protein EVAR_37404_1 [Eumeta japonica]|uniref:Uncharacterized protein n=1 Tax=Eumeta variegata TaxID=151549 RepID=A0A4C1WGJ9_EUMVA|nr:hypothetical protein EVAR_37404_1 [Eumeta japonica]
MHASAYLTPEYKSRARALQREVKARVREVFVTSRRRSTFGVDLRDLKTLQKFKNQKGTEPGPYKQQSNNALLRHYWRYWAQCLTRA